MFLLRRPCFAALLSYNYTLYTCSNRYYYCLDMMVDTVITVPKKKSPHGEAPEVVDIVAWHLAGRAAG